VLMAHPPDCGNCRVVAMLKDQPSAAMPPFDGIGSDLAYTFSLAAQGQTLVQSTRSGCNRPILMWCGAPALGLMAAQAAPGAGCCALGLRHDLRVILLQRCEQRGCARWRSTPSGCLE